MTLLHCALLGGDVRLVKRLVDAGSDIHARNAYGDTCLYLGVYTAAVKGFVSTFEKIVDWKEEMEESDESTLLFDEDSENTDPNLLNQSVLDLLISRGADVNAGNHDGHAPLHYAASVVIEFETKCCWSSYADVTSSFSLAPVVSELGILTLHLPCILTLRVICIWSHSC